MRLSFCVSALTLLVSNTTGFCKAEESLDFVAEHILEVPMDLRYLALPQVPVDPAENEWRLQGAGGRVSGGRLMVDVPMLGLQFYAPLNGNRGLTLLFFYDYYHFSGKTGRALVEPSFAGLDDRPDSFYANVRDVGGNGYHAGIGAGYIIHRENGGNFQVGAMLETLNIRKFAVDFDTIDLPENYFGTLDYAGTYNAFTPYISYESSSRSFGLAWSGKLKTSFSIPLPRVGFKGSISGPDFKFSGDTDKTGKGTHIPDIYLGVGYSLEHTATGFRFDVGGFLYSYLLEPLAHTDIDSPVFISVSKSFW